MKPNFKMIPFDQDERGSLTIFSLFCFILMIMIGGLAMDLMRFEAERKRLQNTIDGAVLAASDLKQALDSENVVRSHFEKQGYNPDDVDVRVDSSFQNVSGNDDLIARTVSAVSTLEVNTILMPLLGVDHLSATTGGQAKESRQNVEISLVLDISGSMRYGKTNSTNNVDNRIMRMRDAVKDFIDIVMQVNCDADGNCVQSENTENTTINIVPFAGSVNIGADLFDEMGGQRWHQWSTCLELESADFDDMRLPSQSKRQVPHFMKWSIDTTWMEWGWCPKDTAEVVIAENNAEAMKTYIDNLRLHDGTATHIGMKYGAALLNPQSRAVFGALNGKGKKKVKDAYKDRPLDYEEGVVKYLILMTDGQTTTQMRPDELDYSILYMDPADRNHGQQVKYDKMMDNLGSTNAAGNANPAAHVERNTGANYRANKNYVDSAGVKHNTSKNNSNFKKICDEAKKPVQVPKPGGGMETLRNDRITVFTIAFLINDTNVQQTLRDCASGVNGDSHFFNVESLDLGDTFTSIARTINQLRLTQ